MKFQILRRTRIQVHLDVGEGHVDPHHLWERAPRSLQRNPVVLVLVDEEDVIRQAAAGVLEVGAVIEQDGALTNEVASRAKRPVDRVGGPGKDLVLRREHRQTFGRPRVDHLVHRREGVVRCLRRRRLTFSQLTNEAQRPVDQVACRDAGA